MHALGRTRSAFTLLGTMVLAGCGGGVATGSDRQAGQAIAVGEPNPGAPVAAEFIAQAQQAGCADVRNRLYLIDQKYVFADVAGNCGDASYAYSLYGATPKALLCSQADSIAGPVSKCTDEAARALFDVIVKHRLAAGLGLGASHQVEPIAFASKDPGSLLASVPFVVLEEGPRFSPANPAASFVIRNQQDWLALWDAAPGSGTPPAIDFSKSMVLGIYLGAMPNGCYDTAITDVLRQNGVIKVLHTNTVPGAMMVCTQAFVFPSSLVVVARSDDPVEFVAKRAGPLK